MHIKGNMSYNCQAETVELVIYLRILAIVMEIEQ
jgi:hypothetical protein